MAKSKSSKGKASRFELDGEVLEIDVNDLTFGEVEFCEQYFDRDFESVDWESGRGILVIAALAKARKDETPPEAALHELRDVKVNVLKKAASPKRPTKTAGDSGAPS